jgi:Holliday junction resolvasome RuvABC endonuclease subunit
MRVLGIDPGLASTGLALVNCGERRVLHCHRFNTDSMFSTAERVEMIAEVVGSWVSSHRPDLVSVEGWTWHGAAGYQAANLARVIGEIVGTVRMLGVPLLEVTTTEAKAAIGLRGKVSKARVKLAVNAMFCGERLPNEHTRDAAVVAYAGARKRARNAA